MIVEGRTSESRLMDFHSLKDYLLGKKGAKEDFPFDPHTLVLKVMSKMFALIALEEDPLRINLKCDPEHAEALRAIYPAVLPGYHMDKRHWNTIILDGSIPDEVIHEMIDDSYALVVKGLRRADREKLSA